MTPTVPDRDLISTCCARALELLRRNATPSGIRAASDSPQAQERHYTTIFGRDAAICALGMVASGEADLVECARAGLRTLGHHQAANGQIPNYVDPAKGEVDFWYTGCIDATLWWLIAIHWCDRLAGGTLAGELAPQITRALQWLTCQEHPQWGLLQQNEASDWADIMPRSGFVLYSNALWYGVKRLYRPEDAGRTQAFANELFYPFGEEVPAPRRLRLLAGKVRERLDASPFYLSFVNFSVWGEEGDLFGNLLALLTGLAAPSHGDRIIQAAIDLGANRPFPLRVVGSPIEPKDPLWRPYMLRHRQNLPWQYHNGGCWPFVGGFWVLALHQLGREEQAWHELESLARANSANDWEFNEWFHGTSGASMGMAGQSWNAAMFLFSFLVLSGLGPGLDWEEG